MWLELNLAEMKPREDQYIIMKAIVFPYINVLWGGVVIMVAGMVMAMVARIREYRRELKRESQLA